MEFDECFFCCGDDEESEADGGGKKEREKAAELKCVPNFFQIIFAGQHVWTIFLHAVADILSQPFWVICVISQDSKIGAD